MRYRELRNLSSHTYDENKAALIRVSAGEFIADAGALERELSRGQTP
jgi:hypothetical protein